MTMPQPSFPKIPQSLVEDLDSLCTLCPKGSYTEKCPFKYFAGVSWPTRKSLFEQMELKQVTKLFDLATDCSCPKDPRSQDQGSK